MTSPSEPRVEVPCPSCAEPILAAAKKCKHCGAWITVAPPPPPPAPTPDPATPRAPTKPCPWCAEEIQVAARVCRFCGRNTAPEARAPLLESEGHYNVPVRFEQQSQHSGGQYGGGGPGFSSSSMGIAFKGAVCPKCQSGNYVTAFSIWHGILAIFAFPIGLIAFAFPIKKCVKCDTPFGAGAELEKTMRILAIIAISLALLALFLIVVATN